MSLQRLAVSIGCPSGIGPEVSVRAADHAAKGTRTKLLLVGDAGVLERAARTTGVSRPRVVVASAEEGFRLRGAIAILQPGPALARTSAAAGRPSRAGGAAQLSWIDVACDLVASGRADALVTGPVSKEVIATSGAPGAKTFLGHTEHLARRVLAREVVMAFAGQRLTTSLVTTHLPLSEVPAAIDAAGVARSTYWLVRLLAVLHPKRRLRVAVASLNPHAGEGGLLGREERRSIVPGIARARARLLRDGVDVDVMGPVPAETAFRKAVAVGAGSLGKAFDGVVAMYHDQATIPMKCVAFGEAVNVSLGLPIVRTSVDHGTGYDIAGKALADPSGMIAALALAERLSRAGLRGASSTLRARAK